MVNWALSPRPINAARHGRHEDDAGLTALLEKIHREAGWDFTGYKKSGIARCVGRRVVASRASSYGEYSRVLDGDPDEWGRLFSSLTINVSEFFRDTEVFDYLRRAIPRFSGSHERFKIWSCGCAGGEEAYSMSMLLEETLTGSALKHTSIYATDIDTEALDAGRTGEYREDSLKNVTPEMLDKYFILASNVFYKVNHSIMSRVKFGFLDIVKGHQISHVKILLCRNLFIYFGKALQEAVFKKLNFALRPGGLLALGRAEVVPAPYAHLYARVDPGMSVYRKRE
ncbi:MAG: protein-glutamate O-methyltransferase CheR [Deltaproteobacteria bacterium]|nr:protein-glutamate O-methyltransferase CheR [Deltaproteobacteria bacterium]